MSTNCQQTLPLIHLAIHTEWDPDVKSACAVTTLLPSNIKVHCSGCWGSNHLTISTIAHSDDSHGNKPSRLRSDWRSLHGVSYLCVQPTSLKTTAGLRFEPFAAAVHSPATSHGSRRSPIGVSSYSCTSEARQRLLVRNSKCQALAAASDACQVL